MGSLLGILGFFLEDRDGRDREPVLALAPPPSLAPALAFVVALVLALVLDLLGLELEFGVDVGKESSSSGNIAAIPKLNSSSSSVTSKPTPGWLALVWWLSSPRLTMVIVVGGLSEGGGWTYFVCLDDEDI